MQLQGEDFESVVELCIQGKNLFDAITILERGIMCGGGRTAGTVSLLP